MGQGGVQPLFDALLREHLHPVLADQGFRRSGATWARRNAATWSVINVQRSGESRSDLVRFTVNLGAASTLIRTLDGAEPRSVPSESACDLRARLGTVAGLGDRWWHIRRQGDLADIGASTCSLLIELGLPWLARLSDEGALADELCASGHVTQNLRTTSLLLASTGRAQEAAARLAAYREHYRFNPARRVIADAVEKEVAELTLLRSGEAGPTMAWLEAVSEQAGPPCGR